MRLLRQCAALWAAFSLALAPAWAESYLTPGGLNALPVVQLGNCVQQGTGSANWNCGGPTNGSGGGSSISWAPAPGANASLIFSDTNSHGVNLPAGTAFKVHNLDTTIAFCTASTSTSTAAASPAGPVQPGSTNFFFQTYLTTTYTALSCISPNGTLNISIDGGAGNGNDSGGGSGGGSNASVGTNNVAGPTSTTQFGCQDASGKLQPNSINNPCYFNGNVLQATSSVPINISTATTTQLVAISSGKAVYVTSWDVIASGTGNITLEYGTGSNCGTGTTALTGPYALAAQFGIAKGNGLGPILVVPANNALCAVTSAAVQMSGSVSFVQQ